MEHLCKFSDNGCPPKMMLADITEHEDNCLYKKVKCKFSDNGCQTEMMLADITKHEDNCLYRKVKCSSCKKEVLVSQLSSHGTCWSGRKRGKSFERKIMLDENWAEDVIGHWPDKLLLWDGKEFYIRVSHVEQGRSCFFVAMVGNGSERGLYKATFYLQNCKTDKMEMITVSEVLSVEALTDKTVVRKGAVGSVGDDILQQRYSTINGEGRSMYTLKYYITGRRL